MAGAGPLPYLTPAISRFVGLTSSAMATAAARLKAAT
jgi:hypothetical protein